MDGDTIMRVLVTIAFLWTLLIVYILFNLDSEVKWARYCVKGYIYCWLLTLVTSGLSVIWFP